MPNKDHHPTLQYFGDATLQRPNFKAQVHVGSSCLEKSLQSSSLQYFSYTPDFILVVPNLPYVAKFPALHVIQD